MTITSAVRILKQTNRKKKKWERETKEKSRIEL